MTTVEGHKTHSDEFFEQRLREIAPDWEQHLEDGYHLVTLFTIIIDGRRAAGKVQRRSYKRKVESQKADVTVG